MNSGRESDSKAKVGLAGVGLAAFAVVCCAGAPLLIVGVAALGTGVALGMGAAALAATALVWALILVIRSRRRAASGTSPRAPSLADRAVRGRAPLR